jgi:phosphinothricin acetyltransferase
MSTAKVVIEEMRADDWARVRAIYAEGIATGDATFEIDAPSFETWDAAHLRACRLVARIDGEIAGWAALSPVSSRCVYGGVAEVSVYVGEKARGRGVGRKLLSSLVKESERNSLWTLQAGVLAENEASIRLHESCGFRIVGKRERLGKLKGVWRDVVLLERRSRVVGND